MQFSMTLFALAAAMGVSADVVFKVANFTAACIPHSSECSYDFILYQPGAGETSLTGVDCSAMVVSDGTLPNVTEAPCTNSSRTFSMAKLTQGGMLFTASQPVTPSSNQTGKYTIPASNITTSTTGASVQQAYTGPSAFDLSG